MKLCGAYLSYRFDVETPPLQPVGVRIDTAEA